MTLEITARTRVVGFHRWPDAPEHLAHLSGRHRHEFRIAVTVAVEHSDRAVEFHELRALIEQQLLPLADGVWSPTPERPAGQVSAYEFGSRSCEALASGLAGRLEGIGYRVLAVTVSEDGENDATWRPDRPISDTPTALIPTQAAAQPDPQGFRS